MTSVVVALLQTVLFSWRSRAALHAEILPLRHQLHVLQRSRPQRIRLTGADRALWIWLSRIWSGWSTATMLVKPATVVAGRRQGFRLFWTWKSGRRLGRPRIPTEVRSLIRTMSEANPLWGAPRIHGERTPETRHQHQPGRGGEIHASPAATTVTDVAVLPPNHPSHMLAPYIFLRPPG